MATVNTAKTKLTKKGLEKITSQFSSRRTLSKLPHFYAADGTTEMGDADTITKNLITVIEELRTEFNNLYNEVELMKSFIVDVLGLDADAALSGVSTASTLTNTRFSGGSLYFTVSGTEYEVKLIKII